MLTKDKLTEEDLGRFWVLLSCSIKSIKSTLKTCKTDEFIQRVWTEDLKRDEGILKRLEDKDA